MVVPLIRSSLRPAITCFSRASIRSLRFGPVFGIVIEEEAVKAPREMSKKRLVILAHNQCYIRANQIIIQNTP